MTTSCLQEKIDKLQNTVHALLHKSNYMAGVYVDDLAVKLPGISISAFSEQLISVSF